MRDKILNVALLELKLSKTNNAPEGPYIVKNWCYSVKKNAQHITYFCSKMFSLRSFILFLKGDALMSLLIAIKCTSPPRILRIVTMMLVMVIVLQTTKELGV